MQLTLTVEDGGSNKNTCKITHPMWFQQEMVLQNQEQLLSFLGWQLPT